MKAWSYTRNSTLTTGITPEGLPYFENRIQGWNDNNNFSDLEDLVILNAVFHNVGAELRIQNTYTSEDAWNCPFIREKHEETEQILLHEINLWLNGVN